MGLRSALRGNASGADVENVEERLEQILPDDEKVERAIANLAVEATGPVDVESELRIWIRGEPAPVRKTFTRGRAILEVQKALATYGRP
jgi:hypothetical protein